MTYLLSIDVSSCVCFQRVVTRVSVSLSFSLSQYICLCVYGGGCERDNRTVCICKYSLREDKHLGEKKIFPLFVLF